MIEHDVHDAAPPSSGRTLSQRYQQKRDQLIETAVRKFNMLGVRGATLEDIAGEVGLNLTSIRHYFRRKDDLVATAFRRSIDAHAEQFQPALKAGGREARVRALVRCYFDLRRAIREGRKPEVMIFGDMRALSEAHAGEVWPRYVDLFRLVRAIAADPDELAANRPAANARAHFLLSQLVRTVFWLPHYPTDALGRVELRFLDLLLHGMAAQGCAFGTPAPVADAGARSDPTSWEAFLRAATRLINEQGYRGASVERIAAQLNRTKGSFYHHVDAKDDLVVACFNRSLGLLQAAQRNAIASERTGMAQAHAAVSALVRGQQAEAGPLLRSTALMSVDADKREPMLKALSQVVVRFSDMVTDGLIDGSARPCDPRIAGEMLMVTVNSAAQVRNWVTGVPGEDVAELYLRMTFRGLFA